MIQSKTKSSAYIDVKIIFTSKGELLEEQVDTLSQKLEQWLHAGAFHRVDEIFQLLKDEFFDDSMRQLDVPLTLLMVVHGAENPKTLPHREEFVEKVWQKLAEEEGETLAYFHLGNLL